ncbi:MAG: hypothetical protein K2O70_04770, partial [Desulfovibrionaceae bacterium]|nr:hypothetical protein [Desulfovibrionaceae bacterium]
ANTLETRIQEEKAETQRLEQERLRADLRYMEVPEALARKFKAIGVEARVNTRELCLPGYRGRKSLTCEPFSRWFFKDDQFGGALYKVKKMMKERYKAQFTKEWIEHSGAWWHISSSTDLEEFYNFLV